MKIVAKTDKGLIRSSNQDAYAVGELPGEVAWAVVCDGMGGEAGGNIASALAVKVISEKITSAYNEKMRDASIKNLLDSAISAANIEVYDMAKGAPRLEEEKSNQTTEINNALKMLVDVAVEEDKPVVADLKEDT